MILDLTHKNIFLNYLAKYPSAISEHTFTNLFIWRKARPIEFIELDGALVILAAYSNGYTIFGPPIGKLPLVEIIAELNSRIQKPLIGMERIPFEINIIGWQSSEDKDNFDYVYRREDLAELAGRKYHNKRNLIAQCLSEYDCAYEKISASNLSEVKAMMERWCKARECGKNHGLCVEYEAISKLLENYGALDIIGAAIRIDGKIEAFTAGEVLNQNTAVIHFEKAMPEFKGLYQLINQWFCKNTLSRFEFINREQDLGVEGLRKAKESYFPDHFVKKYAAYSSAIKPVKNKASRCEE